MIDKNVVRIIKNISKINNNFYLDKTIYNSTESGDIIVKYSHNCDNEIFSNIPVIDVYSLCNDIEELESYDTNIEDNHIKIVGYHKKGLKVKIDKLFGDIDNISEKVEKIIGIYNNEMEDVLRCKISGDIMDYIFKKSKKVDQSDPIITFRDEDGKLKVDIENKNLSVMRYSIDIDDYDITDLDSKISLNVENLKKLVSDKEGYHITIKKLDMEEPFFLVHIKPLSIENIDYYFSIVI